MKTDYEDKRRKEKRKKARRDEQKGKSVKKGKREDGWRVSRVGVKES